MERDIMSALSEAEDHVRSVGREHPLAAVIASAQSIICNSWSGPGTRLDELRRVHKELRGV